MSHIRSAGGELQLAATSPMARFYEQHYINDRSWLGASQPWWVFKRLRSDLTDTYVQWESLERSMAFAEQFPDHALSLREPILPERGSAEYSERLRALEHEMSKQRERVATLEEQLRVALQPHCEMRGIPWVNPRESAILLADTMKREDARRTRDEGRLSICEFWWKCVLAFCWNVVAPYVVLPLLGISLTLFLVWCYFALVGSILIGELVILAVVAVLLLLSLHESPEETLAQLDELRTALRPLRWYAIGVAIACASYALSLAGISWYSASHASQVASSIEFSQSAKVAARLRQSVARQKRMTEVENASLVAAGISPQLIDEMETSPWSFSDRPVMLGARLRELYRFARHQNDEEFSWEDKGRLTTSLIERLEITGERRTDVFGWSYAEFVKNAYSVYTIQSREIPVLRAKYAAVLAERTAAERTSEWEQQQRHSNSKARLESLHRQTERERYEAQVWERVWRDIGWLAGVVLLMALCLASIALLVVGGAALLKRVVPLVATSVIRPLGRLLARCFRPVGVVLGWLLRPIAALIRACWGVGVSIARVSADVVSVLWSYLVNRYHRHLCPFLKFV